MLDNGYFADQSLQSLEYNRRDQLQKPLPIYGTQSAVWSIDDRVA